MIWIYSSGWVLCRLFKATNIQWRIAQLSKQPDCQRVGNLAPLMSLVHRRPFRSSDVNRIIPSADSAEFSRLSVFNNHPLWIDSVIETPKQLFIIYK